MLDRDGTEIKLKKNNKMRGKGAKKGVGVERRKTNKRNSLKTKLKCIQALVKRSEKGQKKDERKRERELGRIEIGFCSIFWAFFVSKLSFSLCLFVCLFAPLFVGWFLFCFGIFSFLIDSFGWVLLCIGSRRDSERDTMRSTNVEAKKK